MTLESRFDQIKRMIFNPSMDERSILNIDTLLDAFIILYDECSTVTMEKPVKEFLQYGKKAEEFNHEEILCLFSKKSDDICED